MPSMKQLFKAIDANRAAGRHHTVGSYSIKTDAVALRHAPAKDAKAPSVFGRPARARHALTA